MSSASDLGPSTILLACCPAHGVEARDRPGAPLALQRGPGDRAVRAARAGHQPRAAADGVDDRRRPRAAVLVPARLPSHHVLGRRRLAARPARCRPRAPACTPSRRRGSSGCAPASCGCTGSPSTGSSRGPAPTATGCPTTSTRRSTSRRSATCSSATASAASSCGCSPDLRALRDAVIESGYRFSMCRMAQHRSGQSCSGRSVGNRMTSRIDVVSVSSITRRSMPMPRPAVGGRPYSRARR